jgi:hypothetical protein
MFAADAKFISNGEVPKMAFPNKEIVIKESKNPEIANYFIAYGFNNKNSSVKSYQILSLLKKQQDIMMEFDSTLVNLPTVPEIESAALKLLKNLQEAGVELRHQQSEAKDSRGLLGIFNINRKYTAHRILAYIPDKMWSEDSFQKLIPRYGVRYYICKEGADGQQAMEDIYAGKIGEEAKKELFSFIIYDCIEFGQMGVQTAYSKAELEKQLTI